MLVMTYMVIGTLWWPLPPPSLSLSLSLPPPHLQRAELPECTKVHSVTLKDQFEEASKRRDYRIEEEVYSYLQSFLKDNERKIETAKKRLTATQETPEMEEKVCWIIFSSLGLDLVARGAPWDTHYWHAGFSRTRLRVWLVVVVWVELVTISTDYLLIADEDTTWDTF